MNIHSQAWVGNLYALTLRQSLYLLLIFIENTHPSYLNDYIEEDPDNPQGTRNTERGRELFNELEEFVKGTL